MRLSLRHLVYVREIKTGEHMDGLAFVLGEWPSQ